MNTNLERHNQAHSNQPETLSWVNDKRDDAEIIEDALRAPRIKHTLDETYERPELPKGLRALVWVTSILTMSAIATMYVSVVSMEDIRNPAPLVEPLRDSVVEMAPRPKQPIPLKRKDRPELSTIGLLDPQIREQFAKILSQADEIIALSKR